MEVVIYVHCLADRDWVVTIVFNDERPVIGSVKVHEDRGAVDLNVGANELDIVGSARTPQSEMDRADVLYVDGR